MILGYIKDENGNLVRKWVKEGEEKNPDILYKVEACFGNYAVTDEEHMAEAKEKLLENMFDTIRKLATDDKFWIIKDPRAFAAKDPLFTVDALPPWVQEGKITVAWKFCLPSLEGYYNYDEAQKIRQMLEG